MQDYAIARRARKSLFRIVAQKSEVIIIKDVRAQEVIMNQNNVRKIEVALTKAKNAALLAAKKHFKVLVAT